MNNSMRCGQVDGPKNGRPLGIRSSESEALLYMFWRSGVMQGQRLATAQQ